jgi:HEAT repeat protein
LSAVFGSLIGGQASHESLRPSWGKYTQRLMKEAEQLADWLDALDRPDKQMLRVSVDGLIVALQDSPESVKILLERLGDSNRKNRWPIAYILAHLPQPPTEAFHILLAALDNPDPDVRWAVILLLARLTKTENALMQLPMALFATGTATQRRMVIYYLKELKLQNETVQQALLSGLKDADATVRVAAVITLKEQDLGSGGKKALLELLVRDPDVRVQHAAAITLASLGSPSTEFLAALDQASQTAQAPLKKAVAAALRILQEKKRSVP